MRFTEINLFGVYVAPMSAKTNMAGCQTSRSRPNRAALRRNAIVTSQAATIINVYMIVLSTIVLTVAVR